MYYPQAREKTINRTFRQKQVNSFSVIYNKMTLDLKRTVTVSESCWTKVSEPVKTQHSGQN